jgi:hypothetical protein
MYKLNKRANNMIKNIALAAVFGVGVFALLDYATSIPSVKMSYATNTCVEVENYPSAMFGTTNYSCESMPTKFNHVWVK